MKLNLQHKRAKKKPKSNKQALARSIFAVVPVRKLIKNKRAVSAVISNMILIAAVIVVGFAVLDWSQIQSSNYQKQYTGVINANIEQLQEKIIFEYAVVNGTQIHVYLLNAGTVGDVTIAAVFVNGEHNSNITLHPFEGTSPIPSLNVGAQAYFSVLTSGSSPYIIKIVTGRGSTFVGST